MRYKESKTFLSEEQKKFLEWICSKQSNIPWYWEPNAAEPNDGGHHFIHKVINKDKNYYNLNVKTIIMPFEGQPFQNELIRYVKRLNFKTKVIGYMHAAPLPVPTNLIYKNQQKGD